MIMGLFNFDDEKYDIHKYDNMTEDEIDNELKKIILEVLRDKPYLIEDIMLEIRKIKIDKIRNKNEVRTVSKRKRRTNLPPPDSKIST